MVALLGPVASLAAELAAYPWDSETELVILTRQDALSVLERYAAGRVVADDARIWASALEVREDVALERGARSLLSELLFQLATPEVTEPLTAEVARRWQARLEGREPNPAEPRTAHDVVSRLLVGARQLRLDWLSAWAAETVPFAVAPYLDEAVAQRICAAGRLARAGRLLVCRTGQEHLGDPIMVSQPRRDALLEAGAAAAGSDFVVTVPDLDEAVLVTTAGYAVAAGATDFVERVLGVSADDAKRDFARTAAEVHASAPHLAEVARYFGCRLTP